MFFSNLKLKNQNWTFLKCPFLKNGGRLLKKTLHSSLRRPPAPFPSGYLYGLDCMGGRYMIVTIMQWFVKWRKRSQMMVGKLGRSFCLILGYEFLGDVLKTCGFDYFEYI